MIIEIIVFILLRVYSFFSVLFPGSGDVPLLLPFGIDAALVYAMSLWNGFLSFFPYAGITWDLFLYFVLPFEFLLLVFKLFLGSRTPTTN
jgi:hypothetical protein